MLIICAIILILQNVCIYSHSISKQTEPIIIIGDFMLIACAIIMILWNSCHFRVSISKRTKQISTTSGFMLIVHTLTNELETRDQYYIGPPFAWITALIRLDIESASF